MDPICLAVKIIDRGGQSNCCCSADALPDHIHNCVRGRIVEDGSKELVITLGIFAIIRLERATQIVIPCSDYCIPEKESSPSTGDDDPCKLFKKMKFPLNEFFPPSLNNMGFADELLDNNPRAFSKSDEKQFFKK